jgi:hypothetical protein
MEATNGASDLVTRLMNAPSPKITVPNLEGWQAYCENCKEFRTFTKHNERDAQNLEAYCEYVCAECYTILMTLQRANPAERG